MIFIAFQWAWGNQLLDPFKAKFSQKRLVSFWGQFILKIIIVAVYWGDINIWSGQDINIQNIGRAGYQFSVEKLYPCLA